MSKITREQVMEALKQVYDLEIGLDIVTLGLVYDVKINDGNVEITMTLTTPMCPLGGFIMEDARRHVEEIEGVKEAKVHLTFDPPWSPEMMDPNARQMLGI
ncbi:MAG: aromatic ring hydroxylase [Thermotogae bacterium]|nr:metal-sulfur cluster assembly factor [Thermotogota bacterium]RKX46556.1 MAG: aromatic ring hydroxylase [Thermotogota bacterium]